MRSDRGVPGGPGAPKRMKSIPRDRRVPVQLLLSNACCPDAEDRWIRSDTVRLKPLRKPGKWRRPDRSRGRRSRELQQQNVSEGAEAHSDRRRTAMLETREEGKAARDERNGDMEQQRIVRTPALPNPVQKATHDVCEDETSCEADAESMRALRRKSMNAVRMRKKRSEEKAARAERNRELQQEGIAEGVKARRDRRRTAMQEARERDKAARAERSRELQQEGSRRASKLAATGSAQRSKRPARGTRQLALRETGSGSRKGSQWASKPVATGSAQRSKRLARGQGSSR